MTLDEIYMLRCIELAQKGIGKVAPNPMVGAVLVFEGRIIGEGWHQEFGKAHAEVNCIQSVAESDHELITKSCLYVCLEPCSHFGKTPPCCDLIIKENIPEVVIGCVDTFSAVSGSGIQKLKDAGLKVRVGVLENECRELNKRFFTRQEKNRPFIILKWAETADGFIGAKDGQNPVQISGWAETSVVHKMRMEEDAILIGYHTAFNDNPSLSNRYWMEGKQPLRVVVDFENTLPDDIRLKDNNQETLIFNYHREGREQKIAWSLLSKEKPLLPQIIESLKTINSLIVEGGSKTLQAFIDNGFWDEIHVWRSNTRFLGEGVPAPKLKQAKPVDSRQLNDDAMFLFVPSDYSVLPKP